MCLSGVCSSLVNHLSCALQTLGLQCYNCPLLSIIATASVFTCVILLLRPYLSEMLKIRSKGGSKEAATRYEVASGGKSPLGSNLHAVPKVNYGISQALVDVSFYREIYVVFR